MLLQRHTVSGTPTAFSRTADSALAVTLALREDTITLLVAGTLADQIEGALFRRRLAGRARCTLTLRYEPATGEVVDFQIAG